MSAVCVCLCSCLAVSGLSSGSCVIFSCSMGSLNCNTWDVVPQPRIGPGPPALGAWSLSHCTIGEVPKGGSFFDRYFSHWSILSLPRMCKAVQKKNWTVIILDKFSLTQSWHRAFSWTYCTFFSILLTVIIYGNFHFLRRGQREKIVKAFCPRFLRPLSFLSLWQWEEIGEWQYVYWQNNHLAQTFLGFPV